jgi:CDP-diacylglycerol--glycerol-3-phosphate 3-phosphatidyltransferase
MAKENIYNVPNALSAYRLLAFPFIFYMVYAGMENYFAVFICINLITDVLDGFIARRFNLATRLGAHLDAMADIGTYILALYGVFKFKSVVLGNDIILLWIFLGIYFSQVLVAFLRHGKNSNLHLYSSKAAGYLQGVFFFVLFAWIYLPWFFYIAMIAGILARSEELFLLSYYDALIENARGIYWLRKSGKFPRQANS